MKVILASGDAKYIAFKSEDLNERIEGFRASGDAEYIAFKSEDLNERCSLLASLAIKKS